MLFFRGTAGLVNENDAVVQSVAPQIIGTSAGLVFENDGLNGNTGNFVLTGSPLKINGNIETLSATTSPSLAITSEIAMDLVLTQEPFTQIYTRTYGGFAHHLLISGVIGEEGGSRTLRKGGTGGTLTLTAENVFTGQMQINVATVSVDRIEDVSQPSPLGAGNLPIRLGTGALTGTVLYTGAGESNNRYFQVGSGPNTVATGGGAITSNGTGPLVFTADGRDPTHPVYANDRFNQNDGAVTNAGRTLTINGTNAEDNEIRTVIADNVNTIVGPNFGLVSPVSLTKSGSGKWILSGANSYSGTTTITNGILQIGSGGASGQLGSGPVVNNGTISFNRTDDVFIGSSITGTGRFVQAGSGSVTFGVAQGFSGPTLIEAGTLSLGETGEIASSTSVTVGASGLLSVADLIGGAYSVPSTQTLGGDGQVLGAVVVGGGATLSPGSSPGTLTITDNLTFASGGNYNWQIAAASGSAGSIAGWDLVTAGGILDLTSAAADPFQINIWSLSGTGPDVDGPVSDFSASTNYAWRIASAAGGITGFTADKFAINTTATNGTGGFVNDVAGGSFSIQQVGNDLNLVFTSASGPSSDIVFDIATGTTTTQGQQGYPSITTATSVTKIGGGTLVFDAANSYSGPTRVEAGTLSLAVADAVQASPLTIRSGGMVTLPSIGRLVATTPGLTIDEGVGGGQLDLKAGQITVAAGGISAADLRADLLAGRNGGSWNGSTGIMSSTAAGSGGTRAVGYVMNADGSAKVSYAAAGDVDLSGAVNVFDLVSINSSGTYGSGTASVWNQGDFNYDGVTNVFDLVGVNTAGVYGQGNYFPSAIGVGSAVAPVPEPCLLTAATLGFALAGLVRLGRRR
jgi:fibronectin-binding autotransporter adhesin